jgi:tRNA-2-methylthio-N6-dimethylallyladenosine synthase
MNRRHTRGEYLERVKSLRSARPGLAITTDLIVGFPGETRADFDATLSLVAEVGFTDSFSFKYSPRPGTPVLRRAVEPLPPEEAQARLEELQALQKQATLRAHRARVGSSTRVLVEGPSRRGGPQWTGRCPSNRVVNFTGLEAPRGSIVPIQLTAATPHSLIGLHGAHGVQELPLV